jgi:hypothetical protein
MKGENEFNQFVTSQIKKMGTSYKAFKVSDRFHIGASDWIIFHNGNAVVVEAKYIDKIKDRGAVLNYKITGPQLTFMRSMSLAGVTGWVFIGVREGGKIITLPASIVPENGQLLWQFIHYDERIKIRDNSEVQNIVRDIFGEHNELKGYKNPFTTDRGLG